LATTAPAQHSLRRLPEFLTERRVSQKPFDIGKFGVEQALPALKGEAVQQQIETGLIVATQQTIHAPAVSKYLYKSSC